MVSNFVTASRANSLSDTDLERLHASCRETIEKSRSSYIAFGILTGVVAGVQCVAFVVSSRVYNDNSFFVSPATVLPHALATRAISHPQDMNPGHLSHHLSTRIAPRHCPVAEVVDMDRVRQENSEDASVGIEVIPLATIAAGQAHVLASSKS